MFSTGVVRNLDGIQRISLHMKKCCFDIFQKSEKTYKRSIRRQGNSFFNELLIIIASLKMRYDIRMLMPFVRKCIFGAP